MRTSYSALTTFKQCPLKFKFQEVDKISVPKSKEALFGTAIHESLRFMFTRNPLYPTLDEILSRFREGWLSRASKIEIREDEKSLYEEDGLSIIKNFYKKNQPWNFSVVDLESRFEFLIEDDGRKENHTIAGIIDRIDKNAEDEYEIIDYKTSGRLPSQETVDNDLQMSLYNLSIIKRWPHLNPKNIKLSLYFLKHNEKISTFRSESEADKTKKNILATIRQILEKQKNGDFPPTPSALCDWCGYRNICPMWKHEYAKSEISNTKSQNEINEIINEYIELKKQAFQITKKIKDFQTEIHKFMDNEKVERVFGENEYITRKIKETAHYDIEKTRDILEPLGVWKEILKVDEILLNKIIPKLAQNIQEKFKNIIRETKITKTLTISKIKSARDN